MTCKIKYEFPQALRCVHGTHTLVTPIAHPGEHHMNTLTISSSTQEVSWSLRL